MNLLHAKIRFFITLSVCTLLVACSVGKAPSVGFWKADDKNYIEIMEKGGRYSAIIYSPSSFDGTFEKRDFAATYAGGTMTIAKPGNPVALLYNPEQDIIVMYGDETYERVDTKSARIEVDTKLRQIELNGRECKNLQAQVNKARDTFENKAACQGFMTSIQEQRPKTCRLYYTSCGGL